MKAYNLAVMTAKLTPTGYLALLRENLNFRYQEEYV